MSSSSSSVRFLIGGALVSLGVGLFLGKSIVGSRPSSVSGLGGAPAAGAATVSLGGRLDADAVPPEAWPREPSESVVAVLLVATDWRSCEDLGRQLRALHRKATERRIPVVVWSDTDSFETTQAHLRRERLAGLRLVPLSGLAVVEGTGTIDTPAAILFRPDGTILSGVSHPIRDRNVRIVSFVQELEWPPAGQ